MSEELAIALLVLSNLVLAAAAHWLHYRLKMALIDVSHFKEMAKIHKEDAEYWKEAVSRWKTLAEEAADLTRKQDGR